MPEPVAGSGRSREDALAEFCRKQGLPEDAPLDRILDHVRGNAAFAEAFVYLADVTRVARWVLDDTMAEPSIREAASRLLFGGEDSAPTKDDASDAEADAQQRDIGPGHLSEQEVRE